MECVGSCVDFGGTPVTILATVAMSTIAAVAHFPPILSHASIISIGAIGGLLLLGILAILASIFVRLRQRRALPVRLRPIYHFNRHRNHHPHRHDMYRWPQADQEGYPLTVRDLTGHINGKFPRRGVAMGGVAPWPAQGHGANNAGLYGGGDVGIPLYADEFDLYRSGSDYRGDYGAVHAPEHYGSGQGYVSPLHYPAAATAAYGRERPANVGMRGTYGGLHGNAADGVVPEPGVGLHHRVDGRRPASESRQDERGRRLSRGPT